MKTPKRKTYTLTNIENLLKRHSDVIERVQSTLYPAKSKSKHKNKGGYWKWNLPHYRV